MCLQSVVKNPDALRSANLGCLWQYIKWGKDKTSVGDKRTFEQAAETILASAQWSMIRTNRVTLVCNGTRPAHPLLHSHLTPGQVRDCDRGAQVPRRSLLKQRFLTRHWSVRLRGISNSTLFASDVSQTWTGWSSISRMSFRPRGIAAGLG